MNNHDEYLRPQALLRFLYLNLHSIQHDDNDADTRAAAALSHPGFSYEHPRQQAVLQFLHTATSARNEHLGSRIIAQQERPADDTLLHSAAINDSIRRELALRFFASRDYSIWTGTIRQGISASPQLWSVLSTESIHQFNEVTSNGANPIRGIVQDCSEVPVWWSVCF